MIASLPMYERAETVAAHNALWSAVRDGLIARDIDAPQGLTRDGDPRSHWRAPKLILSQTCSLPYRSELHAAVNLIGTPNYGLRDTRPGYYFSVLIARSDDPREDPSKDPSATMAVNDLKSQSGWAAPLEFLGSRRPSQTRLTGSHELSVRAVAEGLADWAAIDAVSWRALEKSSEKTSALRIFARTRQTPGLPLITAAQRDQEPIATAVTEALDHLDEQYRKDLGILSLVRIPREDYLSIPLPPANIG